MEREQLLTRVPRISSVWMNEVTKRAIPSHKEKNKDGVTVRAVDPRVGLTPFIDLDSFHFWKPALFEFQDILNELMDDPENPTQFNPAVVNKYKNVIRRTQNGHLEMFSRLVNFEDHNTHRPLSTIPGLLLKWVPLRAMLDNCRFFLTPHERDLLQDLKCALWKKKRNS